MIFDIKMEDFRRKARLVAGGHMTKAPATITYASVVSRETVRIALLMAALNDLMLRLGMSSTLTLQLQLLKKYGQSLDQNSALMPVRMPSLCTPYMD